MGDQRPTVQRMQLGALLRKLRDARGVRQEDAAGRIGCDTSKISRIENGRSGVKQAEITALLTLYEADDAARAEVLPLASAARQRRRHKLYGDTLPGWFRRYLDLESESTEIRAYQGELVPGLVQTEEYARALVRASVFGVGDDEVERRVRLRMDRQRILERPRPPRVWCVLGEAALRRPVGDRHVMRGQIERLLEVSAEPTRVTVQVLPFEAGAHPALGAAFDMLSMNTAEPTICYAEALVGGTYLDPEAVASMAEVFDRLLSTAWSFARTRTFLDSLRDDG